MGAGRPTKYKPEEVINRIDMYFDWCDAQNEIDDNGKQILCKPYTVSGLCIFLQITRETLNEWEKRNGYAGYDEDIVKELSDAIKRAKGRIENYVEEHSLQGHLNPIISIFNLKNNFGWKDKIETENINHNIDEVSAMSDKELDEIIAKDE